MQLLFYASISESRMLWLISFQSKSIIAEPSERVSEFRVCTSFWFSSITFTFNNWSMVLVCPLFCKNFMYHNKELAYFYLSFIIHNIIFLINFVPGVGGGAASGKTTVCDLIIQQLHDQRVVLVNQVTFCFFYSNAFWRLNREVYSMSNVFFDLKQCNI